MRVWPLLLVLLCVPGCKDAGKEELEQARARYQALVDQGTPPSDPRFGEVLKTLRQVPKESASHPEAQALARAIEGARAARIERPLARQVPDGSVEPDVAAKEIECIRLAEALGRATEAERPSAKAALSACRRQLIELEKAHHSHEPGQSH